MNKTLVASSKNRKVPSSLTIVRSIEGWASKSKSSSRQGEGSEANRSRLARRRTSVASTSTANRRSKKALWPSLCAFAWSSSAGQRLGGRREAQIGEVASKLLVDGSLAHAVTSTSSA